MEPEGRLPALIVGCRSFIPVAEGGGECDLSNMRTLCLKCHRAVTDLLRERLVRQRVGKDGKTATI